MLAKTFSPDHRIDTVNPPDGNQGSLRIINSVKLHHFLKLFLTEETIGAAQTTVGLGKALVALAKKKA